MWRSRVVLPTCRAPVTSITGKWRDADRAKVSSVRGRYIRHIIGYHAARLHDSRRIAASSNSVVVSGFPPHQARRLSAIRNPATSHRWPLLRCFRVLGCLQSVGCAHRDIRNIGLTHSRRSCRQTPGFRRRTVSSARVEAERGDGGFTQCLSGFPAGLF